MSMSDDERYMVLSQEGTVTRAACTDVPRDEAWRVARALRAAGAHVYIMRLDTECATCVVAGDEPLPDG
jgi:hypothetical protein